MKTFFLCAYSWLSIQSFIVGLRYAFNRDQRYGRFIFLICLFTFIISIIHYVYRFTDIIFTYPEYSFLHDVIDLCYGPVIFLFARYVFNNSPTKSSSWHFIAPAAYFAYFVIVQLWLNAPFKLIAYVEGVAHKTLIYCILFSLMAYTYLTYGELKKIKKSGIPVPYVEGAWLNILLVFLVVKSIHIFFLFLFKTYLMDAWFHFNVIRYGVDILFFLACALILVAQGHLTDFPRIIRFRFSSEDNVQTDNTPLYVNVSSVVSTIDEIEVRQCAEAVVNLFDKEKVYLDSSLEEKGLAKRIGCHPRHITRFLNFYLQTNFSEFVNYNRVKEAKMMLLDPENDNIAMPEVAKASGFKSESAFYANFKHFTGLTPKSYKKNNQVE